MINHDELMSLTRRDPLAWGISFFDLLEDKKWEVGTRAWATEIYQANNPWVIEKYPTGTPRKLVVTKSTQAGISTMALVKALHFAVNWNVRIGYTLPRQQDTLDFVTTRVDPIISATPYLRNKLGQPNSAHAKRIGNSYLFFMEMSTEPRMMPLDSVFVDEVDLSEPDNLASVLNRMDASRWKLVTYLSTPTVPGYGIHNLYLNSDKKQWLVKCPSCDHEQPIEWEENLRVVGAHNNPTQVFYGCVKCNTEITVERMQTGRWVAEHPELSTDVSGFHVHQMLTTPAAELYKIFRDPQTSIVEFYRKRLGKPYEIGSGSITRDDLLATAFDEPYEPEPFPDGRSTYYIGVDQGNELQVLVAKTEPGKTTPKIVHIEIIPIDKGFDRLKQLIAIYKIRRGVVDANPNRHSSISLTKDFPGRILIADYTEQKTIFTVSKGNQNKYLSNVTINRTAGFDGLMDDVKKGLWRLPGNPSNLSPDVELLIDHVTAIKRDIETRRTPSGEVGVAVWKKLRADHLAHAWLYLKIAIDSDRGRGTRVAIIGAHPENEPDTEDKTSEVEIVGLLAEAAAQIPEFLQRQGDDTYEVPFPLSFKLTAATEKYDVELIMAVMKKYFSNT